MVGRTGRIVHVVRDAVVLLLSIVIIGSQYSRLGEEPVFLITVSVSAVLVLLSSVDLVLIVVRPRTRGYFVGNAVFQLVPGLLYLGLVPPLGAVIVTLNILALVSLRQKKTPEELLRNQPVPITTGYRVVSGVGSLAALASIFIPWFDAQGSALSLFQVYFALFTHSGLPSASIPPSGVVFALFALAGSPASVVCGALGQRWRRFSLVAGVLAVAAGAGFMLTIPSVSLAGPSLLVGGGACLLAGFFAFRGRRSPLVSSAQAQ